jgi:hypothetical protein
MPIRDRFWQYAKEAMLLAYEAKTNEDKQALLDLSRTWALAAIAERHILVRDKAIPALEPNALYLCSVMTGTIGPRNEQGGRVSS